MLLAFLMLLFKERVNSIIKCGMLSVYAVVSLKWGTHPQLLESGT